MIINSVLLKPFGGLTDNQIDFKPGLNIILGPNETGKSTIYRAIQNGLFKRTDLRKNSLEYKDDILANIPIGGDVAYVEISFNIKDKLYKIRRQWGTTVESKLILPDGAVISSENEIQRLMDNLLPAKEGTFKSVLMTYQTGLSTTIEILRDKHQETLYTLGDILRRSILETGGVSVDALKKVIEKNYDDYLGRWNIVSEMPEGGRDITNPWKVGAGKIAKAYYDKEEIELRLEKARSIEKQIDELNEAINKLNSETKQKDTFVNDNKSLVESISKRKSIESEMETHDLKILNYKEAMKKWPVLESELKKLNDSIGPLKIELKELSEEKEKAEKNEKNRKLFEKYESVKKKDDKLIREKGKIDKIPKLSFDDLKGIQKVKNQIEQLEAALRAGQLSLIFTPIEKIELDKQVGMEDKEHCILEPGKEPLKIKAKGKIHLEHSDWTIDVFSGEEDYETLMQNLDESTEIFKELLKQFDVVDIEQAKKVSNQYEAQLIEIKNAENNLKEELDDMSFDDLEGRIKEIGEIKETKPLHEITEKIAEKKGMLGTNQEKIHEKEEDLKKFEKQYQDQDNLITVLTEETTVKKKLEKELGKLPKLPSDLEDPDEFVQEYESTKNELEDLKEENWNKQFKIALIESSAPEESAQELEREYHEKNDIFQKVLKKGKSISLIKEKLDHLLESIDSNTYESLQSDLEVYIKKMTNDKYAKVAMDESLPEGFIRSDGSKIPYSFLSIGTKDVLALSIRLAIAKYFLRGSPGVLIMDDPLVDMDPERQQTASKVLNEFAKEKQLILFTCHPSHAQLFGGNRIEL